jgi:hypothetical protein
MYSNSVIVYDSEREEKKVTLWISNNKLTSFVRLSNNNEWHTQSPTDCWTNITDSDDDGGESAGTFLIWMCFVTLKTMSGCDNV